MFSDWIEWDICVFTNSIFSWDGNIDKSWFFPKLCWLLITGSLYLNLFWWNKLHRVKLFDTFTVWLNPEIITRGKLMEPDLAQFSISHTVGWRMWFTLLSPQNNLNYHSMSLWVSFVNLAACWEENDTHSGQWMHLGIPIFSNFCFPPRVFSRLSAGSDFSSHIQLERIIIEISCGFFAIWKDKVCHMSHMI